MPSVDYQGEKGTLLAIQLSKCVWVSVDEEDEQVEVDGRGCDSAWMGWLPSFQRPLHGWMQVVEAKRGGNTAGAGWARDGGRESKEREMSR